MIDAGNFCHIETVSEGVNVLFFAEFDGEDVILHQVTTVELGTLDLKITMPGDKFEALWPHKMTFDRAAAKVIETAEEIGLKIKVGSPAPEVNLPDVDDMAAVALGAAVLARVEDPAVREIAIRNALTMASKSPSPETRLEAIENLKVVCDCLADVLCVLGEESGGIPKEIAKRSIIGGIGDVGSFQQLLDVAFVNIEQLRHLFLGSHSISPSIGDLPNAGCEIRNPSPEIHVTVAYAHCCSGSVRYCDCINKNHGTAVMGRNEAGDDYEIVSEPPRKWRFTGPLAAQIIAWRDKHGNPNGTEYEQGQWDMAQRVIMHLIPPATAAEGKANV